ncbi:hypothetical protein [Ornithinimicrobium avium]|uniref:Uncharacterized protein n=1 Tax=Ornithinimicrobium avium TaxID=2283195 RepID=A0A345NJ35_9MICO|nr:hypothetical protein [Ornithinimicrobium avium]AXH95043.1 hypothetical protein DV701_01695 [Ornithinimicrobium avium]
MTSPADPASPRTVPARSVSRGLLLLAGAPTEVADWAARSVVPLFLVPTGEWTGATVAGDSRVAAPYDDAATVLAARPVPGRAGPALGFFQIEGRAVLTVHAYGRRRGPGWVVWEPDAGLLRPPGLQLAGPAEIVRVAGAAPEVRDELVDLLHETRARPLVMLQAVLATLGLPLARLLEDPAAAGSLEGVTRHEPRPREVGWFEDAVADGVRLRRELGVLQ